MSVAARFILVIVEVVARIVATRQFYRLVSARVAVERRLDATVVDNVVGVGVRDFAVTRLEGCFMTGAASGWRGRAPLAAVLSRVLRSTRVARLDSVGLAFRRLKEIVVVVDGSMSTHNYYQECIVITLTSTRLGADLM